MQKVENKPLTSIRGIAALWVVGHHWFPGVVLGGFAAAEPAWTRRVFGPGDLAVDLFFILSGLIIARVYGTLGKGGRADFFLRRIFRIYPLHVLVTTTFGLAFILAGVFRGTMHFPLDAFLFSIFLIVPFGPVPMHINPPTWSVAVELICYLAFPVAMIGLRRYRSKLLLVGLAAGVAWLEWRVQHDMAGVITGLGAIARGLTGFALGMILTRLSQQLSPPRAAVAIAELCAGGLLIWAIEAWSPGGIALASALLLFCLIYDKGPIAVALRHPVFVWLGEISFAVYLIHYPLFVAFSSKMPPTRFGLSGFHGAALWLAAMLPILLVCATIGHLLIERPARRIARRLRPGAWRRWPGGRWPGGRWPRGRWPRGRGPGSRLSRAAQSTGAPAMISPPSAGSCAFQPASAASFTPAPLDADPAHSSLGTASG